MLNIDAHAAQRIAIIMSLHSQDLSLYAREKSSARVAGLADPKPPPELDLLRLAFCIRLTGGRPRQQQPIGEAAARPMLAVLAQTQNEKLTASERGIIARLAVNELARCTSAETGDWLVPFYAPPPFAKHLPIWDRYRQALDLLNAILEGDQES
ncbi:MAG TPA: hypothetical protein VFK05_19195 [Polyangiaceae bacterium]|nr:hypothetical protein [Polyangiaceae bacterium]